MHKQRKVAIVWFVSHTKSNVAWSGIESFSWFRSTIRLNTVSQHGQQSSNALSASHHHITSRGRSLEGAHSESNNRTPTEANSLIHRGINRIRKKKKIELKSPSERRHNISTSTISGNIKQFNINLIINKHVISLRIRRRGPFQFKISTVNSIQREQKINYFHYVGWTQNDSFFFCLILLNIICMESRQNTVGRCGSFKTD